MSRHTQSMKRAAIRSPPATTKLSPRFQRLRCFKRMIPPQTGSPSATSSHRRSITESTKERIPTSKYAASDAHHCGGAVRPNMKRRQSPAVQCRVGAGLAPDAPHGPVRDPFGHTVRQQWPLRTKDLAVDETTRRHDCCCPSGALRPEFVQSAPASLRQFLGSKSLLPFLGADVMPGFAFPRSCECYRGSLGPRFPTPPGNAD